MWLGRCPACFSSIGAAKVKCYFSHLVSNKIDFVTSCVASYSHDKGLNQIQISTSQYLFSSSNKRMIWQFTGIKGSSFFCVFQIYLQQCNFHDLPFFFSQIKSHIASIQDNITSNWHQKDRRFFLCIDLIYNNIFHCLPKK